MSRQSRRSVLRAAGVVGSAALAGCAGVFGGGGGDSLPSYLDSALDHFYVEEVPGTDETTYLELRRHPAGSGAAGAAGPDVPRDLAAVEWSLIATVEGDLVGVVLTGDFTEVDPASIGDARQVGEAGGFDVYARSSSHFAIGENVILTPRRSWIDHTLERIEADAPPYVEQHPAIRELVATGDYRSSSGVRLWLDRSVDAGDETLDPDAMAVTSKALDEAQSRYRLTEAYHFADGYDDATVAALEGSLADRDGAESVSVDRRGTVLVLTATVT